MTECNVLVYGNHGPGSSLPCRPDEGSPPHEVATCLDNTTWHAQNYSTSQTIMICALQGFKHSLLSVDMDVCMWLCMYVCVCVHSLRLNVSKTMGLDGWFLLGAYRVPNGSRMVTLWMTSTFQMLLLIQFLSELGLVAPTILKFKYHINPEIIIN